jgi:hypothetical protein
MKNHNSFLSEYDKLTDDNERQFFLKGYLLGLPSKEMLAFIEESLAITHVFLNENKKNGTEAEKSAVREQILTVFDKINETRNRIRVGA